MAWFKGISRVASKRLARVELLGKMVMRRQIPPRFFDDPQWVKLALQHLVLLIHAQKCQNSPAGDSCSVAYCKAMKKVIKHIAECTVGPECKVKHCASSKDVIYHWKYCTKVDCPLCEPIRKK